MKPIRRPDLVEKEVGTYCVCNRAQVAQDDASNRVRSFGRLCELPAAKQPSWGCQQICDAARPVPGLDLTPATAALTIKLCSIQFMKAASIRLKRAIRLGRHFGCLTLMALVLWLYVAQPAAVSQIIPEGRSVDWSLYPPGVKGGVFTNRAVFTNMTSIDNTGTQGVSAAIQSAINICPSNQVVYLPSGTFLLTTGLVLKSGITLRGAGPRSTFLVFSNDASVSYAGQIRAYTHDTVSGSPANSNNIVNGSIKYSTNIVVQSTNGLAAGKFALIDQINDPNVFGGSYYGQSSYSYLSRLSGSRLMGQIVELLSVSASNVTFTPPLAFGYIKDAQITPLASPYRGIGIEDLCVSNACLLEPSNVPALIRLGECIDSWVVGVSTRRASGYHIILNGCFRCEVRDSDVQEAYRYTQSEGYGIDLMNQSTACLIQNNFSWATGPPFIQEGAGPWNVWGYNYAAWVTNSDGTMETAMRINHGGAPHMNLFEGNVGNGAYADDFHGGSAYQTLFRNWFKGWEPTNTLAGCTNYGQRSLNIGASNYFYNVVGNVLGDASPPYYRTLNYLLTPTNDPSMAYIYRLGWPTSGSATNGFDDRVSDTLFVNANYDYCSNSVVLDASRGDIALPDSMYLSGKPEWFGNLRWPPIGPDRSPMVTAIPAQVRYDSTIRSAPSTGAIPLLQAAEYLIRPLSGGAPLVVTVDMSSAGRKNLVFDFGDGSISSNTNHTYTNAGVYTVSGYNITSEGTDRVFTYGDIVTVTNGVPQ